MKEKINTFFIKVRNNKILCNIGKTFLCIILVWLALIPITVTNSGYYKYALCFSVFYLLCFLISYFLKNRKNLKDINIKDNIINNLKASINKEELLMMITFGIFINILFFALMSILNNNLSYEYAYGNYTAYSNVPKIIYIFIVILLNPLLNNLMIRRNINRFKNVGSIIYIIIMSAVIMFTSPSIISGIYFTIIYTYLNIKYFKERNLTKITIEEMIIALILVMMTLLFSKAKIVLSVLFLIVLIANMFTILYNKKEQAL